MGTLYQSQAAAGYNSSPPPDDGSQGSNNQITWNSTIKGKLADPIKALADAINSQLTTTLDLSPRAISTNDSAVASDHWRTLQVTGTTTITLSDAATMTNKYVVGIANLGTNTVTITRATGANTVNGTAADFTIPPKSAVVLGVNQAANGYNIITSTGGNSNNTSLVATTSVVTPLVTTGGGISMQVGTSDAQNLSFFTNNITRWVIPAGTAALRPNADNTQDLGDPAFRIAHVFTPIIDSGTTGSLSLKTNNGSTGAVVTHVGGTLAVNVQLGGNTTGLRPFIGANGETNTGLDIFANGSGSVILYTAGGVSPQLEVLHTASANRRITITGSNGGNPTISTTAGSLAITPDIVAASTISIGTTPALGGTLRLPYTNTAIETRDADNTTNLVVLGVATINSVKNITTFGNLSTSSAGVIFVRRSAAGAPTTSDIPDGCWTLWRDTSGATTKFFYNNGGSLQSVALV